MESYTRRNAKVAVLVICFAIILAGQATLSASASQRSYVHHNCVFTVKDNPTSGETISGGCDSARPRKAAITASGSRVWIVGTWKSGRSVITPGSHMTSARMTSGQARFWDSGSTAWAISQWEYSSYIPGWREQ